MENSSVNRTSFSVILQRDNDEATTAASCKAAAVEITADTKHSIAATTVKSTEDTITNNTAHVNNNEHDGDDDGDDDDDNSLSHSVLRSALHDRQRRAERQITKTDLQRARRYGLAEEQPDTGRIKYTLGGQVFVYEPKSNTAVTCWKLPDHETAASRHTDPIILLKHSLSQQEYWHHENIKSMLQKRFDLLTSHTVIVVDMSGSMKKDDVPGARCRSDGVFLTLARDFIQPQILQQQQQQQRQQQESRNNDNVEESFDVVSIIVMKDQDQFVLLQAEPLDWVLYNMILDLRENAWSTKLLKPSGHGCYLPALDKAEELLWMHQEHAGVQSNPLSSSVSGAATRLKTTTASAASSSSSWSTTTVTGMGGCALSLLFFSDGKPSDPHCVWKQRNNQHSSNDLYGNRDGSYQAIANRVGRIASRLGRRLTLGCIAMASGGTRSNDKANSDEFLALQQMVREAQAYGSMASFHQPRVVHSESLSEIMTTLVTSMTSAKTELTRTYTRTRRSKKNHHHHERLSVRTDIIRERSNHWGYKRCHGIDKDEYLSQDWRVFRNPLPGQPQQKNQNQPQYTVNVWTWDTKRSDWAYLMDPRCQHCFSLVADENFATTANSARSQSQVPGRPCWGCKACFFCFDCIQRGFHLSHTVGRATTECQEYVRERRQGSLLKRSIPSFSVAVKKFSFGEGAERVAFKFRYLDAAGRFLGPKMVAKESRFVQDQFHPDQDDGHGSRDHFSCNNTSTSQRRAYHTQFLQTQAIASRFADLFNKALDDLVKLAPKRYRRQLKQYPRIRFVEPLVFELQEGVRSCASLTTNMLATMPVVNYLLVEPMIEGSYRKFNNNMGAVVDMKNDRSETEQRRQQNEQQNKPSQVQDMMLISRNDLHLSSASSSSCSNDSQLKVIEEDSDTDDEDEESTNNEDGWCIDKDLLCHENGGSSVSKPKGSFVCVHDSDFPQAFSHFTYAKSKKNIMVVDLQGALNVLSNGKREFVLTDPAIHKRRRESKRRGGGGGDLLRQLDFGRTDRGSKGMQAFFETHCCNDVCRMLGLKEESTTSDGSKDVGNAVINQGDGNREEDCTRGSL